MSLVLRDLVIGLWDPMQSNP